MSHSGRLLSELVLLVLLTFGPALHAQQTPPSVDTALEALDARSFAAKGNAIDRLAELEHPRVKPILSALLEGRLYRRKSDDVFVIEIGGTRKRYDLIDALRGDPTESANSRELSKIKINNTLRSQIGQHLAALDLRAGDPQTRLSAVQSMLGEVESANREVLTEALTAETDPDVRQALEEALALIGLADPAPAERIAAIGALSESLDNEVYVRLSRMAVDDPDAQVREAAAKSVRRIDSKRDFYRSVETLFFGLSLGSVLFLAAVGLAITFGVMGVINMSHGELIMLGAYTTYLLQAALPSLIEWSLLLAIPLAFVVTGLVGIAIERSVIRHLYGRPLETLLATFGISLILQQLVRTGISAQNVPVSNPQWMSGSLEINALLTLTNNRLLIFIFSLFVFVALLLVLNRSNLGLHVRAVAQNRSMAQAMGIRTDRVDALTFGLGAGIAGVAGVALSQLTNVGPNMGQSYIVDSFLVVVFGGVGNLLGTLIAAMGLGVVNKFLEPQFGAVLAKILLLGFIILFIQRRPRGLFPQKGRAAGH